jgi:hypothetical protein
MKFVEQRSDDDCLRAALASVLDLAYEDVPENVRAGDEQHNRMQAFLSGRGLVAWTFGLHGVTDPQLMFGHEKIPYHLHPTGYWLASVGSPRNEDDHGVVMRGSHIVWDPHPQRGLAHRGFTQAIILMPWEAV